MTGHDQLDIESQTEGSDDRTIHQLFGADTLAERVDELASAIRAEMGDDFVVVGILTGSFIFVADLIRAFDRAGARPQVEFMRLASYGLGTESSGDVQVLGNLPKNLGGKRVLLVDDIQDTGRTLAVAVRLIADAGASDIKTCALLDKPERRAVYFEADFVGFRIPDVFVVGYGIDFAEGYRHLPYIGHLS